MREIVGNLFVAMYFATGVLAPVGLGIIAWKRGYSVLLFVTIGMLLGPVAEALAIGRKVNFMIPLLVCCFIFGLISFVTALRMQKRPKTKPFVITDCPPPVLRKTPESKQEITLIMPLPPGTRDWGDKR